jgi:hypothetical protein
VEVQIHVYKYTGELSPPRPPVPEVTLTRAGLDVLEKRNFLLIEGIGYRGITSIKLLLFRTMNLYTAFTPILHVIATAKYNIAPSFTIPQSFEKDSISNFMKIHAVGTELFHADR